MPTKQYSLYTESKGKKHFSPFQKEKRLKKIQDSLIF